VGLGKRKEVRKLLVGERGGTGNALMYGEKKYLPGREIVFGQLGALEPRIVTEQERLLPLVEKRKSGNGQKTQAMGEEGP